MIDIVSKIYCLPQTLIDSIQFILSIEKPEFIIRGNRGTIKAVSNKGKSKWLVVIYREISKTNGFILTAYFLDKRPKGDIIWRHN